MSGIDSKDVTQGKLGNCWFVAACGLVAQEAMFWRKVIVENICILLQDPCLELVTQRDCQGGCQGDCYGIHLLQ